MSKYYLAIDIGASSGRHILSHLENGKMILEEIHRFPNGNVEKDGELTWDIDGLFREIVTGMKKCKELGKIPVSVGIDTWAVDIVLLDEGGKEFRSVDFARYLEQKQQTLSRRLVFIVGGPYGFSPDIYALAREKVSLSRMTFSHQMVRLFFVEQYYRAMTIIKGEPYHHE